ncbi:hypothetical protein [Mesorhizobium sp. M0091]|uniref:hypothetical protein n=1 Tax=Mesorhizobium sp. M0091 TaxID=2956875 RepID=UPI00333CF204
MNNAVLIYVRASKGTVVMDGNDGRRNALKKLYVFSMLFVLFTSTLVIYGIGGWVVAFGSSDFRESHGRRGIFLVLLACCMFYGYIKYDEHETKIRIKRDERKALVVRFKQIVLIIFVSLFVLLIA